MICLNTKLTPKRDLKISMKMQVCYFLLSSLQAYVVGPLNDIPQSISYFKHHRHQTPTSTCARCSENKSPMSFTVGILQIMPRGSLRRLAWPQAWSVSSQPLTCPSPLWRDQSQSISISCLSEHQSYEGSRQSCSTLVKISADPLKSDIDVIISLAICWQRTIWKLYHGKQNGFYRNLILKAVSS